MSKKKHSISYIKPDEPKFLRELKEQAGFKEGPTIETKREGFPGWDDSDQEDPTEEEPVVVVLKKGDLTAEEAEEFKEKKETEEANAPADLSKRIIFRKAKVQDSEAAIQDQPVIKKRKKSKPVKAVLSFNDDDNE